MSDKMKVDTLEAVTLAVVATRRAFAAIQGIPNDVATAIGIMRKVEQTPGLKAEFERLIGELEDYDLDTFNKQFAVIKNSVRFDSQKEAPGKAPEPKPEVPEEAPAAVVAPTEDTVTE